MTCIYAGCKYEVSVANGFKDIERERASWSGRIKPGRAGLVHMTSHMYVEGASLSFAHFRRMRFARKKILKFLKTLDKFTNICQIFL